VSRQESDDPEFDVEESLRDLGAAVKKMLGDQTISRLVAHNEGIYKDYAPHVEDVVMDQLEILAKTAMKKR
jgi:hypothetical protein